MRRVSPFLFALFLVAAASSTLSAQQSIYMVADTIRGDQPSPHTGEFKLNSFSAASSNTYAVGTATGGLSAGKASFSPVKVSMRLHGPTSASFYRSLALGTIMRSVEIRLYNSTNRLFYKTAYENVILTGLTVEGSDDAVVQLEFAYSRVRWFSSPDATGATPPVQIGCYDIAAIRTC